MKKCIFFLTVVFFLFFSCTAFAQLVLDKREIKIEAKPGETVSGSITVTNKYSTDVTLKAYCQDFDYEPPYRGYKTVRPLGSTPRSFGAWINLTTPTFIVPSKGKQDVTYSIRVPQNAKGGYYAVIFFEKGDGLLSAGRGVGVIEKAGCALLLETTNSHKAAKIDKMAVQKDAIEGSLSNAGDSLFMAQGSYYIMDAKGNVVDRAQLQKYYLPAQANVIFSCKVSKTVPSGKYTLMVNFDSKDGGALVKEVDFSKDNSGSLKILAERN